MSSLERREKIPLELNVLKKLGLSLEVVGSIGLIVGILQRSWLTKLGLTYMGMGYLSDKLSNLKLLQRDNPEIVDNIDWIE